MRFVIAVLVAALLLGSGAVIVRAGSHALPDSGKTKDAARPPIVGFPAGPLALYGPRVPPQVEQLGQLGRELPGQLRLVFDRPEAPRGPVAVQAPEAAVDVDA